MTREPDAKDQHGVRAPIGAGTPSPLASAGTEAALETLEFARVLDVVADRAAGPLGAARLRARRPTADFVWIQEQLAAVEEVAVVLRREQPVLVEPVPDARSALARVRIEGSVLDGPELALLRRLLRAARLNAAELRRLRDDAPRTSVLDVPLPDKALDRALEQAIDDDGFVLDTASPVLAAARRAVQGARARLVKKLEQLVRSVEGGGESGVTVRNGRYVIPVRRDSRQRPDGIVHDESASHGTLFVEPSASIELGNALREAEVAEERETLAVLRALTSRLRPEAVALSDGAEMSVRFDELVARARYAVAMDGARPELVRSPGPLVIRQGRHPLLLAGTEPVVPFELALDESERTLVVSGPNTGGKTVLLKAVGLMAALAQSGIIPPVGAGSVLPVFERFFADIGDHQSIAANLSTFSAHVAALRAILDEADAATLVLLDEVGSGTDPAEGAALASAALLALSRRGTTTLATTHLGALKTLPERLPAVVNASLEFDATTIRPTYRFQKGVPGRSYGLAIARRLGVDPAVLEEADAEMPLASRTLDALLADVEQRRRVLEAREAATAARESDNEARAARLAAELEQISAREQALRRQEREAERRAREQARAYLLEARQRVEQALGVARAAVDEATAREARRLVEEGVAAEARALAEQADVDAQAAGTGIAPGARVRVPGTGTGDVLEVRGDGRAVVLVGALRMVVETRLLSVVAGEKPRRAPPRGDGPVAVESPAEVDLRGLTGDEAEVVAAAAIDAAVLADRPRLRIIHGKGTGVVRDRVRRLLSGDSRVESFAFAPSNQGGTGVTVVELRP